MDIQGLIPLGGTASRMKNIPKFLLPCKVNYSLLDNVVELFNKHNIHRITAGVSESNNRLLYNYNGLHTIQVNTKTMSETVYKMIDNQSTCKNILIMPDTYFTINNEINDTIHMLDTYDIVVILWKIKDYQIGKVGQCNVINGELIDIKDKTHDCEYPYFWGVISWNSNMNRYIDPTWETIGDLIKISLDNNIKVGHIISDGEYYDCGTYSEYFKMIKEHT
uniref:Nucleotidyl transferase domain-containing protein n=1 Tax=viral metagenome TaxID=1070528 RepID=A0A6C0K665_9ZZZZ